MNDRLIMTEFDCYIKSRRICFVAGFELVLSSEYLLRVKVSKKYRYAVLDCVVPC